ncbi:hypothetical protein PSHT_06256 [Puccinia striiformis]|uniref:Uncharacterized protein n=1 Tax=Puccinia striiformis TaxID=27350 RepID=A0A2S4W7S2_9BASI|nr:hypothetical protein PSHT_06256 [Puccinia striiformis]
MLAINLPRRPSERLAGLARILPPIATGVKATQCKTSPVFIEVRLVPVKLSKEKLIILKETLQKDCHKLIEKAVGTGGTIVARRFFGTTEADLIVNNINKICDRHDMEVVIGGKGFDGQIDALMESMENYINDPHNRYPEIHVARNESVVLRDVSNTQRSTCENSLLETNLPRCTASSEEANLTKVEIE